MKCASSVFTGLKIFPDLIPFVVAPKVPSAFPHCKRSPSDRDMPVQNEKIFKEILEIEIFPIFLI
jgi:hypothetical protein